MLIAARHSCHVEDQWTIPYPCYTVLWYAYYCTVLYTTATRCQWQTQAVQCLASHHIISYYILSHHQTAHTRTHTHTNTHTHIHIHILCTVWYCTLRRHLRCDPLTFFFYFTKIWIFQKLIHYSLTVDSLLLELRYF
jgi:hypothetical protein